jgi:hypothetical protein
METVTLSADTFADHDDCLAAAAAWDAAIAAAEVERLRARVEGLEELLGLMIANNLAGSVESLGLATERAIAVLPDWQEKANGYTRP